MERERPIEGTALRKGTVPWDMAEDGAGRRGSTFSTGTQEGDTVGWRERQGRQVGWGEQVQGRRPAPSGGPGQPLGLQSTGQRLPRGSMEPPEMQKQTVSTPGCLRLIKPQIQLVRALKQCDNCSQLT